MHSILPPKFRTWLTRLIPVLIGVFVMVTVVSAATLTTPRNYLSRQQAGLTTGVTMQVFFTTATAVSGGAGNNRVILVFPNDAANNTKWCKTNSGTITPTGIANPTGATETATSLPGSLAGTCTQTPDTFTITGVNDLSSATKYGVQIVGNSSAIGTGDAANSIKVTVKTNNGSTDIDTATLALSLIANDQVTVSATVDPTLTVALSGNTAAIGTLSTSNVNQASITSTVSTNATGGFVSLVKYDATLTSGSNTIPDESGGLTIVAGTSEYGASTDDTTSVDLATTSNSCATGTGPMNATALSTTFKIFASESAAATLDATILCFAATTSATQAPGTYQSIATLVTTAKF